MGKRYPWGDTFDESKVSSGRSDTEPVGKYPPNGYGVYDMAGGVREWCLNEYDKAFYSKFPKDNPVADAFTDFTNIKSDRVVRNGSCFDNPSYFWVTHRPNYDPSRASFYLGFRCAVRPGELRQWRLDFS